MQESITKKIQDFSEWLDANEQWLNEYSAETGADRELDFNEEAFAENLYDKYLEHANK